MNRQSNENETLRRDRYAGLDGLRAVACIGIVMMHMASKDNNSYALNEYAASVISLFTDFVYLFMAVSAFGLCCGYYDKFLAGKVNLVEFYKKRYMKILPFFALVVLIDVAAEFSKNVVIEAIADISLSFGLYPNNISVIGVGWFLGLIFVFYMIFPFFCALMHDKKSAWALFAVSLVLNYITGTYFGQGRKNIVFSFCFFVLGGLIYMYRGKLSKLKAYVTLPLLCAAVAAYYVNYLAGWRNGGTVAALLVTAAMLIFAITQSGEKVLHNRFTAYISRISMEIYLCHMVMFRGIEKIGLNTRFGNGVLQYAVTTVLVTACAVVFAAVFRKCEDMILKKKHAGMKKLNGTVIVTYRCNARCTMCNRYKEPSRQEDEISIDTIKKLPHMYFTNITGGEPFLRTDLKDIVRELYKKSDRIVISTNGFFTDRIIDLAKEFPQIGIRISIEGLENTNNEIRGLPDGYRRGYQTLKTLRSMGMKDVGFGMTVQDRNAPDLVSLYRISDELGMEFATASLHNSFYFVESKNIIHDRQMVAQNFEGLINELLKSRSPKKWFRAYFNHGLINYIYGQKRLLPCDMSFDTFFIDPYGDVMPCNGTKEKQVMGNLNEQDWEELWNSRQADDVRKCVRACDRNCWMIGSVSPAMHKYIWIPAVWVLRHRIKAIFTKKPYSMYENRIVRDLRDGKVTKEELDKCSTCEFADEG